MPGRHHRCCRRRPCRAAAGDGGPPAGERGTVLADSGAPGEPGFAVLPGSAGFCEVAGLAVSAKLPGPAARPGLAAPGRPARSRAARSRAWWSRAPIPGLAAASATAALATSSGCGRDTSLARIAASTVIFIVGIVASRLSLARTAAGVPGAAVDLPHSTAQYSAAWQPGRC